MNWSGGKDSSLCLHRILQSQENEVMCLLTSVSKQYQRISMHGVRVELLKQQAERIGIPLRIVEIPEMPSMEDYNRVMKETLLQLKTEGVTHSVFGDIFLEDLRQYRESKLAEVGIEGVFPLWQIPTEKLVREFIDRGFKSVITCVNDQFLDSSFAGRIIDHNLLNDLPSNVDPCGENGEYHSFVFDGPIFKNPVEFSLGEIVHRKYEAPKNKNENESNCFKDDKEESIQTGFWYCDLIPSSLFVNNNLTV